MNFLRPLSIFVCVIFSMNSFSFDLNEFFNEEDKRNQVNKSHSALNLIDITIATYSGNMIYEAHKSILSIIEDNLSKNLLEKDELKSKLMSVSNQVIEAQDEFYKMRESATSELQRSSKLYRKNHQQLIILLDKERDLYEKYLAISNEINTKRDFLLSNLDHISEPRQRRNAIAKRRLKALGILGVTLSLADIAGHMAIDIHSEGEADYLPLEGILETIEFLTIDQLTKVESQIENIEKQVLQEQLNEKN